MLVDEGVKALPWAAGSSNLNLIENLGGFIVKMVYVGGRQLRTTAAPKDCMKALRDGTNVDMLKYLSFPSQTVPQRSLG